MRLVDELPEDKARKIRKGRTSKRRWLDPDRAVAGFANIMSVVSPTEANRVEIAKGRVLSCWIVKARDIIEEVSFRVIIRTTCLASDPFGLRRQEQLLPAQQLADVDEPPIEQDTPLSPYTCS